jgi:hypothetical protein
MLDYDSESLYNKQIALLEDEQLDWLKLMREQTIVVRSTLKSVNRTPHDVLTNEWILTRELYQVLKFINVGNKKIENRYGMLVLLYY